MITVRIDPNVRVRNNITLACMDNDIIAGRTDHWMSDLSWDNRCHVVETESGMHCDAFITELNFEKRLMYIRVPWHHLHMSAGNEVQ